MRLRFAANVGFLFKEAESLIDKYVAAKNAGFDAVETGFPYSVSPAELSAAIDELGLQQVLINGHPGDQSAGELGLAALPGRQHDFLRGLELSIQYAKALNCDKIHILSGKCPSGVAPDRENMKKVLVDNLRIAAARMQEEGLTGLIEPINNFSVPDYFINNFDTAISCIKEINSPHLKLQLDVFHLQMIGGNVTNTIKKNLDIIGHIQVAQVPNRHQPNTPGELNYKYLFDLLQECNYEGWIGCEYNPLGSTKDSLSWLDEYGLKVQNIGEHSHHPTPYSQKHIQMYSKGSVLLPLDINNNHTLNEYRGYVRVGWIQKDLSLQESAALKSLWWKMILNAEVIKDCDPWIRVEIDGEILKKIKTAYGFVPEKEYKTGFAINIERCLGLAKWQVNAEDSTWNTTISEPMITDPSFDNLPRINM